MPKMVKKYERMLLDGTYENEQELCNQEGINYDDLYEDDGKSDDLLDSLLGGAAHIAKGLFGGKSNK